MALSASRISLHGAGEEGVEVKAGTSSAILFKLSDSVLRDLKKASQTTDGLSFATGTTPQLRIGTKTIDLDISPDAFRNELYTSTTGSGVADFRFSRLISHRAQFKSSETKSREDTAGPDAALAALQHSLASYEQEKQAKQATITNTVLPAPKSRFDAARRERLDKKRAGGKSMSQPATPLLNATSAPQLGAAPTSAPVDEENEKMQAMKTPVIHLVAMGPVSTEEIRKETHIPKDDLDSILQKVGKQVEGKWQLTDRTYKDLDVWKFAYPSKDNRQAAIDNAVKAFDRMRLGKDDRLWQMLLPKKQRDQGIVLSRLHLGAGQANRGLTPHYQPSPMPHFEGSSEAKLASGANTPRLGGSTPRPSSSKGDVMKRLLSKDPKKARAAEEEKERKRKEREAAASDRETERKAKKPSNNTTKKTNPNVKSAEFVHSSDDESDGVGEEIAAKPRKTVKDSPKVAAKSRSRAVTSTSSDSSDTPIKSKMSSQPSANKTKSNSMTVKHKPSPLKASAGATSAEKRTPQKMANNNSLSAPNSQQKTQASPRVGDSRPSVPSPLGAARPRVASDVSERGGFKKVMPGGDTPKGLGISNGGRQKEANASADPPHSSKTAHKATDQAPTSKKPGSDTPKAKQPTSSNAPNDSTHKRKPDTQPPQPPSKHRKIDSTSTAATNGTAHPSPDATAVADRPTGGENSSSGSDRGGSVLQTITYSQGVNQAERFRDTLYPAYAKLYDEQAAAEARGETVSPEERERLMKMHKRLEQIKREIRVASQREHAED